MTSMVRRPEACSALSLDADEVLTGTAPHPRAWLALEQPGPWGRKAPSSSHLDRDFGAALDARAKAAGVTFVLIRRPGRHADHHTASRRVLLASHPGAGWLEQTSLDDARELGELDLESLAEGRRPGFGDATADPTVLICTNGRRDLCCAEVGRARVAALAPELGESLWESSHLGGHRFAPTVLLLPSGVVLGRASVTDILAAVAGRVPLGAYRGRSALAPAAQVAEAAVLTELGGDRAGVREADRLDVLPPSGDGPWAVTVRVPNGASWLVTVEEHAGLERPESCGRVAEPWTGLLATSVVPSAG